LTWSDRHAMMDRPGKRGAQEAAGDMEVRPWHECDPLLAIAIAVVILMIPHKRRVETPTCPVRSDVADAHSQHEGV
jgi:hypothetical protein